MAIHESLKIIQAQKVGSNRLAFFDAEGVLRALDDDHPVTLQANIILNLGPETDLTVHDLTVTGQLTGGGTGAPDTAEYLVGALHAGLSAERLVTNTPTVAWDLATGGQAKADVVDGSLANVKLANMAQATVKGRAVGAGTGTPTDLTATQVTALLDLFTDSLKGAVPASGGGTTNFLRADGTWAIPPGSSGLTNLFQSGADAIEERNGVNAQSFFIYNTFTDASNYERLGLFWQGNEARIFTQEAGTGVQRDLVFGAINTGWKIDKDNNHWLAYTDDLVDMGQPGANRPRNVHISRSYHTGIVSPTQITADQNDYNPSGAGAGIWRLNSDATRVITGIAGGVAGRRLTLQNVGSFDIELADQSALSTAANRIITGFQANAVLAPDRSATLWYDDVTSRWRVEG